MKMKINKLVVGVLIALAIVLYPRVSVSKVTVSDKDEAIVLSKSNLLVLNSEVDGESTGKLIAEARELCQKTGLFQNKKNNRLILWLNTPGGSIQSGLELSEALLGLGCPVDTITAFAASMGFQIVQTLGERMILKSGVLMSHHAMGQFEGSFGGVQPSQVDNRYQLWLDRIRELDEQTVKRTNGKQTYESYTTQYDKEMWRTGTKSVANGYADRIVLVRCDETIKGVSTKTLSVLGFNVAYDLDNCPLNTSPMNIRISQLDGKSLNKDLEDRVKVEFMSQYTNKQKQVLPMRY